MGVWPYTAMMIIDQISSTKENVQGGILNRYLVIAAAVEVISHCGKVCNEQSQPGTRVCVKSSELSLRFGHRYHECNLRGKLLLKT